MDKGVIRRLILFFLALTGLFVLLMAVNYFGGRTWRKAPPPETDKSQMYVSALKPPAPGDLLPAGRQGLSTHSVVSEGAIMLVRENDFRGVGEKPKSMIATLNEMSAKRKGPPPVSLRESDLAGKMLSPAREPALRLAGAGMPGLGSAAAATALIAAPVDYKVFKSSDVWQAFAAARRIAGVKHDFSSADLLILVSLSDYPDGIFKITEVKRTPAATVVRYRVDPLAMADEAGEAARAVYAAAPVPRRGPPVKLEQVP